MLKPVLAPSTTETGNCCADCTMTCLMRAIFIRSCLICAGILLISSVNTPVATGDATLVPLSTAHPLNLPVPRTRCPYVTISGLTRPYPFDNSLVVTPRDENDAI